MFTIRRITSQDKEAVLKISSKIWEGSDYIHNVFDRWVADTRGEFTAVLRDGIIVGFSRLSFLTPTDVWLEGLRSDPDANVKGIGRRLSEHYLQLLSRKTDLNSIRFATYFQNKASITTSERLGFEVDIIMSNKVLCIDDDDQNRFKDKALPQNIHCGGLGTEEMNRYLENSQYLKDAKGFICLGWVCYKHSNQMIEKFFYEPKQYIAYKTNNNLSGLLFYDIKNSMNKTPTCNICLIEAESQEVADQLLDAAKIITVQSGLSLLEAKIPTQERYLKPLSTADFKSREQENDFIIYSYPLQHLRHVKRIMI